MSKNLEMSLLLDFYGQMLTPKQRDVMELYYYEDLSLAEIAEHENITRQGVHDFIKRSEQILSDLENKLMLAEKFSKLSSSLAEISSIADRICAESGQKSKKIYNDSCRIKEIISITQNFI